MAANFSACIAYIVVYQLDILIHDYALRKILN